MKRRIHDKQTGMWIENREYTCLLSKMLLINLLCFMSLHPVLSQSLEAMTFNIRFDNIDDGINTWSLRKNAVADLIKSHNPDIIGTQEGLVHQIEYLDESLEDYAYFGNGRDDGKQKGEYCAVFYHKRRWKLLESKTMWLSPTGEVGVSGWDAALPRVFTFGILCSLENQDTVFVINTHFDHRGEIARLNSAKLILDFISEKQTRGKTWIVLGDFNATPDEEPVKLLKEQLSSGCFYASDEHKEKGTFNGFDPDIVTGRAIDHIFVKNGKIRACKVLYDKRSANEFISDHFPVLMTVVLP